MCRSNGSKFEDIFIDTAMAPDEIEVIEEVHGDLYSGMSGVETLHQNGVHNNHTTPQHTNNVHQIDTSGSQAAIKPAQSDIFEPSKTCRITIMLVIFILCLGLASSILGVYMHMTTPISDRDCAIWAGIPLAVTGIVGIYYCGHEFDAYATSFKAFVVKIVCVVLAFASCSTSVIATVFTGLHTYRISVFIECKSGGRASCVCVQSPDALAELYHYGHTDCKLIQELFWKFLLSQAVINIVGSIFCMWFLFMLWKSRYHGFYAGLKSYSYNTPLSTEPRI